MRYQFQSVITPPAPTAVILTGGTITSDKAGTWYFWLVNAGYAGFSLPSSVTSIAVESGNRIQVTIPAGVKTSGTEVKNVYILANTSNNLATAYTVAMWQAYNPYTLAANSLPANIIFAEDEHLELGATVDGIVDLPDTPVLGMLRYVSEESKIYQYKGVVFEENLAYQWVEYLPNLFSPYITDTTGLNGCNRPLKQITNSEQIVEYPQYDAVGESQRVGYLLYNDSTVAIAKGRGIRIALYVGTKNVSSAFGNLLYIRPRGYVNLNTGVLTTTGLTTFDVDLPYQGETEALFLEKDLEPGYGLLIELFFDIPEAVFDGFVGFLHGSIVRVYPEISLRSAIFAPSGIVGEYVVDRWILPNGASIYPIATAGIGRVGQYEFNDQGSTLVAGLELNTEDQIIALTYNGTCFKVNSLPSAYAQRAIVSTLDGVGLPTDWVPIAVSNSQQIKITLTNPTVIRGNYPDAIAGMTASLNASYLIIYVRDSNDDITQWQVAIAGEPSEIFIIGGVAGDEVVSMPVVDSNFGLFAPAVAISTQAIASVFATETVDVCCAYYYEDTVTKIDHSRESGCIFETSSTIVDVLIKDAYFLEPIADKATLATTILNVKAFALCLENQQYYFYDNTNVSGREGNGDFVIEAGGGVWISLRDIVRIDTKASLKAINHLSCIDGETMSFCLENKKIYIFVENLATADDGDTYLESTSSGATTEGWQAISGSGSGGISSTATITSLKAIASGTLTDNQLIHVEDENAIFQYYLGATAAESAPIRYRPNDYATINGNWVRHSIIKADGTSAITSDFVTEGATNLYITSAQESKINNLPSDTVTELSNKADKATTISAGTGLSGGGSLANNRTLSLSYSGLTEEVAPENTDLLAIETGDGIRKLPLSSIPSNTWSAWAQTSTTINFASTIFPVQLTLTLGTNTGWVINDYVVLTETSGLSATFKVTAKSSTNLITINKDATIYSYPGSGTISNGILKTAGAKGEAGNDGADGADGATGSLAVFSSSTAPTTGVDEYGIYVDSGDDTLKIRNPSNGNSDIIVTDRLLQKTIFLLG